MSRFRFRRPGVPNPCQNTPEALELEIAALTVKRDQLREDLEEARYMAMTAREREAAAAAELAHVNQRLEALVRYRRPSTAKEEAASEPAQP